VSLQSIEACEQALDDPVGFSARYSRGAVIDEAQRAPDLDLSRERLNAPFTAPQCEPSVTGSVRYPQLAAGDRRSALPSCHANTSLAGPSAPYSALALGESRNSRAWRILAYGGYPSLREGPLSLTTYRALAVVSLVPLAHAQTPTTYCTAGISTNFCVPQISANVQPNTANSAGCVITTSGLPSQRQGVVFYGVDNFGFTPTPWGVGGSSYLCVKAPIRRMVGSLNSGGTAGSCDGAYVIDWDAFQSANPAALGNPWVLGDKAFVQSWYRDPLAVKTSNLSNALELTLLNPSPLPCLTPISGMVVIPSGTFTQGSNAPDDLPYFGEWDDPVVRQVTISYCFWMGATEVTQTQYSTLMGANPSAFSGANNPVDSVSWFDAQAYCAALTAQQSALGNLPPGYQYRLPTEAEWEYACRAGTTTEYHLGDELFCNQAAFLHSYHSNSSCNSSHTTSPVASYAPNAWGLHDMHGNAMEWCLDTYGPYPTGPVTDPLVAGGATRVLRGGAWSDISYVCRSAYRLYGTPNNSFDFVGFRVVLAPVLVP
jgi:formylglycine-generating enzyme required for sulfatase activity